MLSKTPIEPERGRGEQSRGLAVVVDVRDGGGGVGHLVVHDGVHVDRHGILRQDLKMGAGGAPVRASNCVRKTHIFRRASHVFRGQISDLE